MALAIATKSTGSNSSGSSVVITKPTGLAVGDLMLVHLTAYMSGNGGSNHWTIPTGWARIQEISSFNSGANATIRADSMWKVANSSDVAASTFTFVFATSAYLTYDLMRITGGLNNASNPADVSNSIAGSGSVPSSWTVNATITPTRANSFMLALVSSDTQSATGYAIATNNPTWTEDYSSTYNYVFYATRLQTTATGNSTVTFSGGSNITTLITLAIEAAYEIDCASGSFALSVYTATIVRAHNLAIATGTFVLTTYTATISYIQSMWTNVQKNIASWTNLSKS